MRALGDDAGAPSFRRRRQRPRFGTARICSTPSSRAAFSRSSSPRTTSCTDRAAIRRCGRARRSSRSSSLMIRDFAPLEERIAQRRRAAARAIPAFLDDAVPSGTAAPTLPTAWAAKARARMRRRDVLLTEGIDAAGSPTRSLRDRRAFATAGRRGEARAAFATFATGSSVDLQAPDAAMRLRPGALRPAARRVVTGCTRSRADLLAEAHDRFDEARAELDDHGARAAGSWPDAAGAARRRPSVALTSYLAPFARDRGTRAASAATAARSS